MAHIPEDKLLEIREAASIEEVVGTYVKLERRGKTLLGLCPFHADSKPSFTVSPERGIFHCFGCQAGGNVISFVMQYHKLSFPEAAAELARRYGISLNLKDMGPEESRRASRRQLFYDLHREALAYYRATLAGTDGGPAREYLKKRGLTPEIIQTFQLGYAPEAWDGLRSYLQKKGLPLDAAAEAGLLVPRASGGYYDRFRDRVIFPIFDRQDRPVAFGGRIISEGEPKYLNSPESPLYSKGRLLYGLPQAREALRHEDLAIVVEGYLDLLALRVHGVAPVVASLGTALTREQVRLLKNLVSRVVLVFDGDPAGAKAMRRAFPLFGQEGLPVRVIALPRGMDPDDYVRTHGPELFASPWEAAQPWLAFLLDGLVEAHGLSIEGRVKVVEELKPYFTVLQDPVEQGLWLKFIAERLGVSETDLRLTLTRIDTGPRWNREQGQGITINLEKGLLRWILQNPAAVPAEELFAWAEEMEDPLVQDLLRLIATHCQDHQTLDISFLLDQLEEEARKRELCALVLGEGEFAQAQPDSVAEDWRRALRRRRLQQTQKLLKEKLALNPESLELLAQKQEIDWQLAALKSGGQYPHGA
jgi:DNA primase|uniref:DNA primase n=1 Tax=Desulfobacca acetoxidans TaxID=60893 RepID=A0A7V6A6S9_9BACT